MRNTKIIKQDFSVQKNLFICHKINKDEKGSIKTALAHTYKAKIPIKKVKDNVSFFCKEKWLNDDVPDFIQEILLKTQEKIHKTDLRKRGYNIISNK